MEIEFSSMGKGKLQRQSPFPMEMAIANSVEKFKIKCLGLENSNEICKIPTKIPSTMKSKLKRQSNVNHACQKNLLLISSITGK